MRNVAEEEEVVVVAVVVGSGSYCLRVGGDAVVVAQGAVGVLTIGKAVRNPVMNMIPGTAVAVVWTRAEETEVVGDSGQAKMPGTEIKAGLDRISRIVSLVTEDWGVGDGTGSTAVVERRVAEAAVIGIH